MTKKMKWVWGLLLALCIVNGKASAHFGMIIPSDSMVMQKENRTIQVVISFSHPFEGIGMDLFKPDVFDVFLNGKKKDLTGTLLKTEVMGRQGWKVNYKLRRPGAHIFIMRPTPYWEPAEDCFIIHYTKTVVSAFGDDEGWDREIGLKTEIVPLSKPLGLYAGNVFQGVVKLNGKPVPFASVEIEYYNRDHKAVAPDVNMITQTIKADGNGVFTYAVPRAGWWGFAALNQSDETLKHNGADKEVEIGAVIWVEFHEWVEK